MISKELWLEVIKPQIQNRIYKDGVIEQFEIVGNTLRVCIFYESKAENCKGTGLYSPYCINIYELAHKCKEYLLDEGYYIVIHPFKVELFEKDTNSFIRDFHYPIQDKAIPYDIKREIQASQWILDNKKEEN